MEKVKSVKAETISDLSFVVDANLLLMEMISRWQRVNALLLRMPIKEPETGESIHIIDRGCDKKVIAEIAEKLLQCVESVGDTLNNRDIVSEPDDPFIKQYENIRKGLEMLIKRGIE